MKRICEAGRFSAESERVRKLWMMRVMSQQTKMIWQQKEGRNEIETGVMLMKRNRELIP